MSNVEIEKAIEFLKEFDYYPEYQRKLDFLVSAYYGAVDVKNTLRLHLETEIRDTERIIMESSNIGTVKDNSKLGMKIAYENVLEKLEVLEKRKSKELATIYRKDREENV